MRRLLLLIAAVVATGAAACRDTKQLPVIAGPSVADSADQVLFDANIVMTTRGVQRGAVRADTMYVLDDQTRFDLRNNVHVTFTTETGAPQGTMDAARGTYSQRTQILDGRGNVVVRLVGGKTLRSPHVTYNQMTHMISSDTSFTSSDAGGSTSGIGFTSNESFTSITCLRNCGGRTSVRIPEG